MGLTEMKADTDQILSEWGEALTIKRNTPTYDGAGKATDSWGEVGTITGEWQPVSGSTMRAEEGLEVKSSAQVMAAFNVNVREADEVHRADGSYMTVNYVKKFEDHVTIFLVKTEKG